MNTKLSIIGLGKLGSPIAAAYAAHGFEVIGVDINSEYVASLNAGKAPVTETGLQELVTQHSQNLSATTSITEAITKSNITFIIVATPSTPTGEFSLEYVNQVIQEIGETLKTKSEYHLVVLTSTVMPGATEHEIIPLLEKSSGKTCGSDFGFCYSPEFIALGSVINDFTNPDLVLIGQSDQRAGDILENVYHQACDNQPAISRMNIVNAEIAKLSVNTYCTTKITFANTLARICENIPNANSNIVSDALGLDSRIGRKYLTGALGYGGPCFPRDTVAFNRAAELAGVDAANVRANDQVNLQQPEIIKQRIYQLSEKNQQPICLLGLAYKPDTDVIEESQAILLAKSLVQDNQTVIAYDPLAQENSQSVLPQLTYTSTAEDCLSRSNLVVITTACPEFKEIPPSYFEGKTIIDCWNHLAPEQITACSLYAPLGQALPNQATLSQIRPTRSENDTKS